MKAPGPAPGPAQGDALEKSAGIAFLLLVITLVGPIAPMGIAAGLCLALTLLQLVRTPRPHWPGTPVDRAAIAWLLAIALASTFSSEPLHSFSRLNKGLMPALVGLAAFHARDRRLGRRALALYLSAAGVAAAAGLVAWWSHGHGYDWRARGLSHHYMTFGGQLLFEFPVALAVLLLSKSKRWRWGAGVVALLTAIALAATFTRSAWLGVFAASVLIVGAVWPLGVIALGGCAALVWTFAPGEWGARLHGMFDSKSGYNGERLLMWQAGWRMFREHPLTGVGLQDLHALYEQYKLPQATEKVGHLHNAYVQIAASMGIAGLAAFAWLYTSLLRAAAPGVALARRLRERREDDLAMALRLGVFAALAGFLVAACFEWNFGDEELLYHLYTLAGLAWAARSWGPRESV